MYELKRRNGVEYVECGLIELKFDGGGDAITGMRFQGYGAVFGNVDSYGDVIEPGAFASYLSDMRDGKQDWPAMLSQHGGFGLTAEDMTPVGVWHDLGEDGRGLKTDGEFADTERGTELYKLAKMKPRPVINGLSIGYIAKESEPRSKPEDPRRRLKRIDLIEISPVTFPANRKARLESVKHGLGVTAAETALRDAGFSRREAKAILASGFKTLSSQRDAGGLGDLAALARQLRQDL
mgnify:CR=1 FL=1